MSKIIDMTGQRFGKLVVLKRDGHMSDRSIAWFCQCDCGGTKRINGYNLRQGVTKSCGCLQHSKNRFSIKQTICEICRKQFNYQSSVKPKTCSVECKKQFISNYNRHYFQHYSRPKSSFTQKIADTVTSCKQRAKKHKIPYNIDSKYIISLFYKQNKCCIKTKIPFSLPGTKKKSPWTPSIDQIIPGKGYTKDNVQLVCMMYNFAKHTWTNEDVMKFVQAINKTNTKTTPINPGEKCWECGELTVYPAEDLGEGATRCINCNHEEQPII